mmetsp:Transcript_142030/g.454047  ORF Transcript_142030/g.454047 Transcript_142030/m.454047 type:complete len:89 (+) Transcript_142030:264-530(+)
MHTVQGIINHCARDRQRVSTGLQTHGYGYGCGLCNHVSFLSTLKPIPKASPHRRITEASTTFASMSCNARTCIGEPCSCHNLMKAFPS